MAVFETVIRSDLQKPLTVQKLSGYMFSADNQGNKISVDVYDGGSPATLSGNVMGYVVRADGATVVISGNTYTSLSGNRASIILPASAYVVVGVVSIVIKVGTTTVGACSGYVYRTSTDEIVDPGHVIPSIEELLDKIAACEAATAAANTAAANANAKAALADEKATAANTAATNANTKAALADEKATAANTAATNANTKAALADEKATAANTAATNANTKAALADEKATAANTAASSANTAATNANTKAALADEKATAANTAAGSANSAASSANSAASAANTAAGKIDNMTVAASGLAAGESPTATISEVSGHKHIAFGIPKGDTGATPDFSIGTVQTLSPGSSATASITGTAESPVLNLGIPKGDTGTAENIYGTTVPISPDDSTKVSDAINTKVDKVTGKQLSTEDYTSAEKTKLAGIAEGATANVGTITGITMNGSSKGTSGVVDLGTVITAHQDISGKVSGPSSATGNNVAVFDGTTGKVIKDSGFTIAKSVPSDAVFTDTNTTYGTVSKTASGLCPTLPNETTTTKYLRQDGTWVVPPDNNTTYAFTDKNVTLAWSTTHTIAVVGGTNIRLTMPSNPNTTYAVVSKTANGLCPQLPNETTTTKYLRQDGSWVKPPNDNTTYGTVSKTATGLCPQLPNETTTTKYLRQDGTWVKPPDNNTTYAFTDKNATLAWATTHTIAVVGGVNIRLTMPSNPNTWRGIQNNLTSTSTTDSLSAYQGKVLNEKFTEIKNKTFTNVTIGSQGLVDVGLTYNTVIGINAKGYAIQPYQDSSGKWYGYLTNASNGTHPSSGTISGTVYYI